MKGVILTIIALLGYFSYSFGQEENNSVPLPEIPEIPEDPDTIVVPEIEFPESMASGTLPLISITTEGMQPILSKDSTLNAKMTVTIPDGYITFNGATVDSCSNLDLTIKGRGNATWRGLIKPYKIKFLSKYALLGLPKQKHFALLPFAGYLNYLAGFGGLEVAKLFDWWVSKVEPIELAINGEYRGKYYLTESIKINQHRLNIFEQPDLTTDPDIIPFGWLIEIDNNPEPESSISIIERDNFKLNVTYHVPEVLSEPQRQWLLDEITKINDAIYRYDDSWAEFIDPVSAARYFIIRELFWDPDGYAGSMYLHRDIGNWNEPWKFGPIWDIASGHREKYSWVYESNHHFGVHWFSALIKSEVFMEYVRYEFAKLYDRREEIWNIFRKFQRYLEPSHQANYNRWGYPAVPAGMSNDSYYYIQLLEHNLEWMKETLDERPVAVKLLNPEVDSALHIRGKTVRLSMLAADAVDVSLYSPDGTLVDSFALCPGESRTLSGHGIYVLVATGLKPQKIRL